MCCVLVKTAFLAMMCCLIWTRRGNRRWDDVGQGGREKSRRREKGLGENMGAIKTHLGRKTEPWWKRKVERRGKTDRHRQTEWRLKWQKDMEAGVQREWGGEKWTAAMKQETKKRQRERQTDRQGDISSYQTHVDSPWGPPHHMATDKRGGNKTDIRYEQKESRKKPNRMTW